MYNTVAGSKVDDLFGDGTLFKIMNNEEIKKVVLAIKEMGKEEVGQWRASEIFKLTQEVFDVLNKISGLNITIQHKRGQLTAIDGVVTVDFDVRLLTLFVLVKQGAIQHSPEEATATAMFGSYFKGVVSLKEKKLFHILDVHQAEAEVAGFVINPLLYDE